ncbi:MAG: FAD-dependent oxidoreductase [Desulfobacteraceae bacterium]|nr:MAG: FAD-dependent oxidoreductase [Desulfobacteraceae bacterium]
MAKYDFDMGIVGGGAGGLTVASGAAQLGARTLLVEKEKSLGGDCLHFGCVPSKTLIRTAHVRHLIKHAKDFGLPEVDVAAVDFNHVAARIQAVISKIQEHDSQERFCRLGAEVKFGEAVFTNDHTIKINGTPYSAKNWVIATGSSAAIPPIPGLKDSGYITNRELFSLARLPSSMVILGAGPIGIEMAQAFCRLGSRVEVVDMAGQILAKEDPDMARALMEVLVAEGVVFHLKATIKEVRTRGNQKEVQIEDSQGNVRLLKGDTLLVALGRQANTGGLNLQEIGVDFDRRGIQVDQRMRTSQKHIYAAGDAAGGYLFTHAAGYEGSIVLANAIFHLPRKADYTYFPWCTYTDPELASIGMNETRAKEAGIDCSVWTENFRDNDRSLAEGEHAGKIKLLLDGKEKPIGVQILGPRAGDLLGEWVAALYGNVKLSTLASAVHPYPTIVEINKRVAGSFLSTKVFSNKVKKGLKFFFNLKGRACGEAA